MLKIVPLVEGDGDVDAAPVLIRAALQQLQRFDFVIARPRNAHGRGNLTRQNGLERFVQLCLREPECSAIFVLADIDTDCPRNEALAFSQRVQAIKPPVPVVTVFAKREYESWFLPSIQTIAGKNIHGRPGLPAGLQPPASPENIANPKLWLSERMPQGRSYKETEDQAPMTAWMDHSLVAGACRSFRRFQRALQQLVNAVDQGKIIISP